MDHSTALLTIATCILALGMCWKKKKHSPLPPGPPQLPIIGNLLDMPKTQEWKTYHEWAKQLTTVFFTESDIIYCNIFGVSVIVSDSLEAASDLLERRSSIYSSRPRMPMVRELMGWDWPFAIQPYDDAWRARHRVFRNLMRSLRGDIILTRLRVATNYSIVSLINLIDGPNIFDSRYLFNGMGYYLTGGFVSLTGALTMDVMYGIEVLPENDPYINTAEKAMASLAEAVIPGSFLADFLPTLKYAPAWVPGAGFQTKAKEWSKLAIALKDPPFERVKDDMQKGHAKPSFGSLALQNVNPGGDILSQEAIIREAAGTAYGAAADATVSSFSTFVLAMVKYPDIQAKAQAHLDQILGKNQLPSFNDESSLPYITTIVTEVLRWQPSSPLALPHLNTQKDNYNGYTIPANSAILPNAWAILHDETVYPDPFEFKPERFLKDGRLDPSVPDPSVAFGFGRRVCPGQHMARASIWIVAASMLATMNITKAIDVDGNVIEPSGEYTSGSTIHPLPFECKITSRSRESENVIRLAVA